MSDIKSDLHEKNLVPAVERCKGKLVKIGKGVSIAPDIDFDFKNFKLKSLGVAVHW